jgi:hypothetical protein
MLRGSENQSSRESGAVTNHGIQESRRHHIGVAQVHRSRRMHRRPRMQKDFAFWVGHEGGQSQVGSFRVRVNATQESAHKSRRKHRSQHTHLECKRFWIWTASIKIFCISTALDQNILHLAQDLTLLIKIPWISLVSSSSIHPRS